MIFIIIGILAIISIVWAFWSLKDIQKEVKNKETKDALKKSRVIFHSSAVSSSSSKS